jgi:hypothetical protein
MIQRRPEIARIVVGKILASAAVVITHPVNGRCRLLTSLDPDYCGHSG